MIMHQLLIGLIGFVIGTSILALVSLLAFGRKKTTSKKSILLISTLVSLIYTIGYCFLLFVVEGEGQATGLGQGFDDFMSVLPLFLFIYVFFLLFTALPVSLLLTGMYPSLAKRKR